MSKKTTAVSIAVICSALIVVAPVSARRSCSDDRPTQIKTIREPGDPTKDELERLRYVSTPTGETVGLSIVYNTGTTLSFEYVGGKVRYEREFQPHPAKKGLYLEREAFYSQVSGEKYWERWYRFDGTLFMEDRFGNFIVRTLYAADGKRRVNEFLIDKRSGSPLMRHQEK